MTEDARRKANKKLSREKRLAKAYRFMQSKKAQEMGANKALEELKKRGLGFRRKEFLRKYRLIKEEGYTAKDLKRDLKRDLKEELTREEKSERVRHIRHNFKTSERLMHKIEDMQHGNYQYVFRVKFTDGSSTHIVIASFTNIPIGEAMQTAVEILNQESQVYENELESIRIIEVRKGV